VFFSLSNRDSMFSTFPTTIWLALSAKFIDSSATFEAATLLEGTSVATTVTFDGTRNALEKKQMTMKNVVET
jgi:hypothetical protein